MPASRDHKQSRRDQRSDKKDRKAAAKASRQHDRLKRLKKSRRQSDRRQLHGMQGHVSAEEVDDLFADAPPRKVSVRRYPELRRRSRSVPKKKQGRRAPSLRTAAARSVQD